MLMKTGSGTDELFLSTLTHSCKRLGVTTWLHLPQLKPAPDPLSDKYSSQGAA